MSRAALAAIAVLGFAGCATLPRPSPEAERAWQARQIDISRIDRFTLAGRMSSSGLLGISGGLIWRQEPERFDLRLSAPLGVGVVSLSGTPQLVTIRTKDREFVTSDPEGLLRAELGWALPLSGLRWWALGLPSPLSPFEVQLDPAGRASVLTQDGWQIEYAEYQPAQGYELPRRFAAQNSEARIKAVVDAWSDLPETEPAAESPPLPTDGFAVGPLPRAPREAGGKAGDDERPAAAELP